MDISCYSYTNGLNEAIVVEFNTGYFDHQFKTPLDVVLKSLSPHCGSFMIFGLLVGRSVAIRAVSPCQSFVPFIGTVAFTRSSSSIACKSLISYRLRFFEE
jgi:hypothetical protein